MTLTVVKSPFEPHIYHVGNLYYTDPKNNRELLLTEDGSNFVKWLDDIGPKNWKMIGIGMIQIDPDIESLFVLRWCNK